MNGEIYAMFEGIKLGLECASHIGHRKVVIFTDSKVGMQMIEEGGGVRGNAFVNEMFEWLESQETCNISLKWVPSHLSIPGNERADMLAERGRMLDNVVSRNKWDGRDVLGVLHECVWNKWVNDYELRSQTKGKEYRAIEGTPLKKPFFRSV